MEGRQKTENGGQIDSAEFCHLTFINLFDIELLSGINFTAGIQLV